MLISFFSLAVSAQKIKYKDIYPSLAAKQYETAIPKLETYLSNPDNQDEANPNLQMGLYLYQKAMKIEDTSSSEFKDVSESAISYLAKAKSLIDDKEAKKKGYYESFKRRDLRSGKFLIKVSDIHLDIENKIAELQGKKD